jgi:hypothetical protein
VNILCLDIGTKTGWAVADASAPFLPAATLGDETAAKVALRQYDYGMWNGSKGSGVGRGPFYLRFTRWLDQQIDAYEPILLAYEANPAAIASVRSQEASLKLFGMVAMVEAAAALRRLPSKMVNTAGMQKHAVGTGRDSGKVLRKARAKALGLEVDDNTIDAIFSLSFVLYERATAARAAA